MFVASLILWITKPFPIYLTSLIAVVLLPLLKVVESQKVSFGTLGYGIIWPMGAAFVLASAMSASNLGKRIALTLVTKFGKTPKRTLFVLVVVNFILEFFVPSTTARAALYIYTVFLVRPICPQPAPFVRKRAKAQLQQIERAYREDLVCV